MDKLLEIGNTVASLWGGICEDYIVYEEDKFVLFYCDEYGEKFTTSLSFEEIQNEYNYDVYSTLKEVDYE